jgi:cell division protein ZipA
MDGLRWLLLLFGLLVVVGVYLFTRLQGRQSPNKHPELDSARRLEPSLASNDEADESIGASDRDDPDGDDIGKAERGAPKTAQKIVTLRIVAGGKKTFAGDELALSLRGIGMRHGKFGIFHRFEGSDEDKIIFSAASLVEPGSFDLANLKEQKIPGISLFMVLPGPMEGAQAFDLMMVAARALALALRAELLDESGSTLSIQRERYMREEIIQFEHSKLVT